MEPIYFDTFARMVKSTVLYGDETWRINEKYKKKVEVVEIDAIRRPLCMRERFIN